MTLEQLGSSKTLYLQIKDVLKSKIISDEFKPGGKIPSEKALCTEFGVSRITIRKAFSELIKEGLLYTVHGKGTFVREQDSLKVSQKLMQIDSFENTLKSRGMIAGTFIVSHEMHSSDSELQQILNLESHEKVMQLTLVGTANDDPVVLYHSFFQEDIGRIMYEHANEKQERSEAFSTLDIYQDLRFLNASYIEQTFEAIAADTQTAQIMKVKKGSPLFLVSSIVYSSSDMPIEYKKALYRSDRYKFHIRRTMV